MDDILAKAGSQAVTFAIRSGVSLATSYAIKNLSRFMAGIPPDDNSQQLARSQARLQTKIQVLTPAIDLIELIAARGNTMLDSTLELTHQLQADIAAFDARVATLADKHPAGALKAVQRDVEDLLARIDEAVPLVSLALTTSGANLSARMPAGVSPGRFLAAGRYLGAGDERYEKVIAELSARKDEKMPVRVQVGPVFRSTLYSVFQAQGRRVLWKEEYRRCRVRMYRVNRYGAQELGVACEERGEAEEEGGEMEYRYVLVIEESFKDGRYHDEAEEKRGRRVLDVGNVQRLFFSASGRLLQIEEARTPVLVLKVGAREKGSKVEWLAFEQYYEEAEEEEEEEEDDDATASSCSEDEEGPASAALSAGMKGLRISSGPKSAPAEMEGRRGGVFGRVQVGPKRLGEERAARERGAREQASRASLSLLEYLLRLGALQASDQMSVLEERDERLGQYLVDENGRGGEGAKDASDSEEGGGESREGGEGGGGERVS